MFLKSRFGGVHTCRLPPPLFAPLPEGVRKYHEKLSHVINTPQYFVKIVWKL